MNTNNSRPEKQHSLSNKKSSHQPANKASWWLDFWTTSGRKSENQDSLLIVNCIMNDDWVGPVPLLVLLADGVSACQFPKQASKMAVQTIAQTVVENLPNVLEQSKSKASAVQNGAGLLNDEHIAAMLKIAVNRANDAMYFSQSYERVAPLLSTISGLLCINDRVHLFHTGDSRIYRMGVGNLNVLSKDHRINKGQDKGALSAALGADTTVHLQQTVFTLNQNEYLCIMTDGVHEFIEHTELEYEFGKFFSQLESALVTGQVDPNDASFYQYIHDAQLSKYLCQQAVTNGSNDNVSMITLGMLTPDGTATLSAEPYTPNQKNSTSKGKMASTLLVKDNSAKADSNDVNSKMAYQSTNNTNTTTNGVTNTNTAKNVTNHDDSGADATLNVSSSPESAEQPQGKVTEKSNNIAMPTPLQAPSYKLPIGFDVGDFIDGFEVTRIIARTPRSEVYLVVDDDGHQYVLKSPSINTVDDGDYIRLFLKERKIGLSLSRNRRAGEASFNQINPNRPIIDNIHTNDLYKRQNSKTALQDSGVLRYYPAPASSQYLYHLTEFIEGENLRAFIEKNAPCDIWQTHDLITKISMAVGVMHRNYLLHQDIKPENVLLTKSGEVKLIDFGSSSSSILKDNRRPPVGDLHYAAPEYYTDAPKGIHSDLFSIAVIAYELLTGELPFTTKMLMTPSHSLNLSTDLLSQNNVPASSQQALLRALHSNTNARHQAIGEFLNDFNPDKSASLADPEPLLKRNPLVVWHGICFIEFIIIVFLLIKLIPYI